MPWGDSFVSGFAAGSDIRKSKKDQELRERALNQQATEAAAERALKIDLEAKQMAGMPELRSAQAAALTADASRTTQLTPAQLRELDARAAQMAAETKRTDALTPAQVSETKARTSQLDADVARMTALTPSQKADMDSQTNLRNQQASLFTKKQDPTVTMPYGEHGEGKIQYTVPVADAQALQAQASYKSPYANAIAQLEQNTAKQQSEMADGDHHTGLFNYKLRQDVVSENQKKLTRLRALELQDMVSKGAITQAEADRRAALLTRTIPGTALP